MKVSKLVIALGLGMSISIAQAANSTQTPPAAAPAATTATAPNPNFKTDKEKVSYAIGLSIGENFKTQMIDIDNAMLNKGIQDGITGTKPLMTKEEMQATMMAFQKEMMAKREAMMKQASEKNTKEGNEYLAANKTKTGVVTTASGLQYKIITEGKGAKPVDSDMVTVDYEGKLINGTVFDSSMERGKPVTFPVAQVIPGWTEVLKLMPVGSTWEVVIPPALAYGDHGAGNLIGPNQTLIFKIHLIDIKKSETQGATGAQPAAVATQQKS